METNMNPTHKQAFDDLFNAFSMVSGGHYVSLLDVESGIVHYSPGAVELFRLPGEYVQNGKLKWAALVHPEDRKQYLDSMSPLLANGAHSYDITYRVLTRTGEYGKFRFTGAVLHNAAGSPEFIGGLMIDQGLAEDIDPITVLPHRYSFFQDLSAFLACGEKSTILLTGFSNLDYINRVYGYTYGNRTLQETAALIQEIVADRGMLYRMDNATFALLSQELSREQMAALYDGIRLKMQRGVQIDGIRTILNANGGMISTDDVRMDAETLYSCLTYAYRESKHRLNGELVDFDGSINYDTRESLSMVNTIRDCIIEDCRGFFIDYQPVVSVKAEKLIGLEALIRWNGQPYGDVEPLRFIPILEKDFVFEELAEWIFRRVMKDGLQFLAKDPSLIMSVNISGAQMSDEYFIESISQLLEETHFPAKNLCVEVTKACRLLEISRLKNIVDELHRLGILVIIDDFGTEFESINFLKKLSADYIKLDRELVEGIEQDDEDRQTVEYMSKLASIRGARVCAKGVETEGMRSILRKFDISCMQGNLYSKPEPFDTIMKRFFPD